MTPALIVFAVILSVTFFFWEQYLMQHFLGGYDAYGIPVPKSLNGFAFFFHAWPVWSYPCGMICVCMSLYIVHYRQRTAFEQKQSQQALDLMEASVERVHASEKQLKEQVEKTKGYAHLQDKYRKLEHTHLMLQKDYQRSLTFAERLLEKIPKVPNDDL